MEVREDLNQPTNELVENFFRHESGRMISTLTRIFGLQNIDVAEDVVQDAILKALQQWSYKGVPENPSAWIMQVSKNRALDLIRRDHSFRQKEEQLALHSYGNGTFEPDFDLTEDGLIDDQLRMIFACCHPALNTESQVALTLRTLCGLTVGEIARALLTTEDAIAKRLVRAKRKLRDLQADFCIPAAKELEDRLDTVLQIIYLLFNEGYNASQGDNLIRVELCEEAIRLARLVADHPAGRHPRVYALLALMYLHAARFSTRLNSSGELCLLKDQDRSSWDRQLLQLGLYFLDASAAGDRISTYHLQAGIAACHCTAVDFGSTDWPQILRLYDMLMDFDNSPIVALNRAVAFSRVHGPGQGLEEVVKLSKDVTISNYYLTHAVLGELYFQTDDYLNAAEHFRTALSLTNLPAEHLFLTRSVAKCERRAFDHDFGHP